MAPHLDDFDVMHNSDKMYMWLSSEVGAPTIEEGEDEEEEFGDEAGQWPEMQSAIEASLAGRRRHPHRRLRRSSEIDSD